MAVLKLPSDFESLPEYRLLRDELDTAMVISGPPSPCRDGISGPPSPVSSPQGEDARAVGQSVSGDLAALVIFIRLWVNLAYHAELTPKVGLLPPSGARLMDAELVKLGIDPVIAFKCLNAGGVIQQTDEGWYCDRFARLNADLSPKHRSDAKRGHEHSLLVRRRKQVEAEATLQGMLVPPETYKKADGTQMTATEGNRCRTLILTLDNCLGAPKRQVGSYTDGLMTDAYAVQQSLEGRPEEEIEKFLFWISDHRAEPWMHKSAELILKHFAEVVGLYEKATA